MYGSINTPATEIEEVRRTRVQHSGGVPRLNYRVPPHLQVHNQHQM